MKFNRTLTSVISTLAIACTFVSSTPSAFAISGLGGAIGDDGSGTVNAGFGILPGHVTFGAQFGNTVGFVNLGGGSTGSGTFVPSTRPGEMKFLTAAHNIDFNQDGAADSSTYSITFGANQFVSTTNTTGNATYQVQVSSSQVAVNPLWSTLKTDTHDVAVITFNVNNISTVNGGAVPFTTFVNPVNPQGQVITIAGHGTWGNGGNFPDDGSANTNEPTGIIKAAQNIIDFVGVSQFNTGKEIVLNADFDSLGFNRIGSATPLGLEGVSASGDSGGPIMISQNGRFLIVSVVSSSVADPSQSNEAQFGSVESYPPLFLQSNQNFLRSQGVFLGTGVGGTISFTVVDLEAIRASSSGAVGVQAMKNNASRGMNAHIHDVKTHVSRIRRGTSKLDRVGGAEISSPGGPPQFEALEGQGSGRWEIWAGGDHSDYRETVSPAAIQGIGNTNSDYDKDFTSATVGVDFWSMRI